MAAEMRPACAMRDRGPAAAAPRRVRAWQVASLLVLAQLAGHATADSAHTTRIAADDVRRLDTRALAMRLLPPEPASHAVSHEVLEYSVFRSQPARIQGVGFRLPASHVDGVCAQLEAFVGLDPVEGDDSFLARHPSRRTYMALGAQCEAIPQERYAHLQMRLDPKVAAEALRWLARLRSSAAMGEPLPEVSCASEVSDMDACSPGVATILASLPLERIHTITPTRPEEGLQLSVMPNGPGPGRGHAFWNVRLLFDPATRYRVQLQWMIPPPF